MAKKANQKINCSLKDYNGKEILLPQSVLDIHLIDSNHLEAFNYLEDLKKQIDFPENVVASKYCRKTKIANIKLKEKPHLYLQVVIKYRSFFSKLLGQKNFIVTFYGGKKPKKGKILWKK